MDDGKGTQQQAMNSSCIKLADVQLEQRRPLVVGEIVGSGKFGRRFEICFSRRRLAVDVTNQLL